MPRPPRIISPDYPYHLFPRGSNQQKVFRDPKDYRHYMDLILMAKQKTRSKLYHYELMPNHVHLTLQPSQPEVAGFLRLLQTPYSRYFGVKYKRVGHLWQAHPKCKLIDTDSYMVACSNYIEMNAVRAGLVDHPEDWPYSSYRYYAYGTPDPLVDQDPLYEGLADTPEGRQRAYRDLIDKTRAA